MGDRSKQLKSRSSSAEIALFLQRAEAMPLVKGSHRGRLIFALDATASREPTWDQASHLQSSMFANTKALGDLSVQLCYYRGYRQFVASPWVEGPDQLMRMMEPVRCLGGQTQIARVLSHAIDECRQQPVQGVVFIGDAVEEPVDQLCDLAGQLKLCGTPLFVFHEGGEPAAARALKQIARVSGGVYMPFTHNGSKALEALLSAAAAFSVGGVDGVRRLPSDQAVHLAQLTRQLEP
ncbi:VWA domain-containing protein [Aestuariirhabdus litorea]|uniref:VWA domain-containing protein n=1 Tax=Aestuariirhabdus litorea TaxID=2528527 RepID=A0A3P3VQ60_9GAMM|nr:VWA domain-containing protein [Aestuariirhabdus litorea]RRJ84760.1 VWA domain-containing protein [Aestuariirhabdus litorea]RWW97984.1 VWA domain-containing protein [Endozoicomonadaceae bacterium GTF-13]